MRVVLLAIIAWLLSGCASFCEKYCPKSPPEIVVQEVPVKVWCNVPTIEKPIYYTPLVRKASSVDVELMTKATLADKKLQEGYILVLEAAVDGCREKKQ